jgi:cellulose synthase/poly-beta-1,6-N-acetylglucosamine synthase-like glycosyltransferase
VVQGIYNKTICELAGQFSAPQIGSQKNLVSVIIPARNEQDGIARAVWSVAMQPEVGELIVVNDQSTDRTTEILEELQERIPALRVLGTDGLPRGWAGKNYAAWLGAEAASGDWLLFTDADTCHERGSVGRALADAVQHEAVWVSYSPEQEMETFWERALIPFVYCRLARKFAFARVNDPRQPDAAANGQFILVRRDAYQGIGGHRAVAGEILEDVALARRAKQAGYGIYFAAPIGVVRTRMYRSFRAMAEGWTKNLYPLVGGNAASALVELVEASPLLELTLLLALVLSDRAGAATRVLTVLAGALVAVALWRLISYARALRWNLYPLAYIEYCYLGAALYGLALAASGWKTTQGAVVWKGRAYPARTR